MARSKRSKGLKDPKYKAWIQSLPCLICWLAVWKGGEFRDLLALGWQPYVMREEYAGPGTGGVQESITEAAHVGDRGLSQKCSDRWTIPLCGLEHHREGKESAHKLQKKFWEHHGLDRAATIGELWDKYESEYAIR